MGIYLYYQERNTKGDKEMIENVMIFKNNNTVIIRYESGNTKTYMHITEKVMEFILREDVKAFENEYTILYRVA